MQRPLTRALLLTALLLTPFTRLAAQGSSGGENGITLLQRTEDSLLRTADSMYYANIPDDRPVFAEQFARQLVRALRAPGSWGYTFPKLAGKINILPSGDGAFRIFNWAIAPQENTLRYYGAIQIPGEGLKLYGLVDVSNGVTKGFEDSVLNGGRWFGALYYRVLSQEVAGSKVYTLFGANAASPVSNRKILEPMTLTQQGPVFGAPLFNVVSEERPGQRVARFVLEYKKDVQAGMNWDEAARIIYFDRLESATNDPKRKYTFVPSGQYDGFRWTGDSWTYIQDVIRPQQRQDGQAPSANE